MYIEVIKLNRNVLKILICSLILLIGIGAVSAVEYDSTADVTALEQNNESVDVADDDVLLTEESDVMTDEADDVVAGNESDVVADDVVVGNESDVVSVEADGIAVSEDRDVVADEIVASGDACDVLATVDDAESSDSDDDGFYVLGVEKDAVSTLSSSDLKLSVSLNSFVGYGSAYKTFKGKSHYKWKIKRSKWIKMKKQANKHYKFFRRHGSYHPGYSNGVTVKVKIGGYIYRLTAFAVKNYRGIRCEVRGLQGYRLSTWGDYYL